MLLDCVANRFDASLHVLGDPASDFGRATTHFGQTSSTLDNLLLVLFCKLAEPLTTFHFVAISLYKVINACV